MIFVAKGVTGADIFETYASADIAAVDRFFCILLVGVHPNRRLTRSFYLNGC